MHLEILVEDASGKALLDSVVPKIINTTAHTFRIIAYRGIGHLPKGMKPNSDAHHRVLLDQLPRLLRGYEQFLKDLNRIPQGCNPAPQTLFRLAIEEIEAWLLGDKEAIIKAYPKVNRKILNKYEQDAICGTAELLAEALRTPNRLAKTEWATRIGSFIDPERNASPSFRKFRDGLLRFCQ